MTQKLWQSIKKTALLGIAQKSLQAPLDDAEPALKQMLAEVDVDEPSQALWPIIGTVAVWQKAGYTPQKIAVSLSTSSQTEALPRCNPQAKKYLVMLLDGYFTEVTAEWLQAIVDQNQRVPEEHLPDLLELGRETPQLRPLIHDAIGQRGIWLAAKNPRWAYAAELTMDVENVWYRGLHAERVMMLQKLRQSNPTQARELLAKSWAQESPKDRGIFLNVLTQHLDPEDEPFLETILDDRRKAVRHLAADLLSHLPNSHLVQRMRQRTEPLITLKRGFLASGQIQVTLPDQCEAAMARDGIEESSKQVSMGQKGWWLSQMIAAIPPQVWTEKWQKAPSELLKIASKSEAAPTLLLGWAVASRRYKDHSWLEAFAHYWLTHIERHELLSEADLFSAFQALPPTTLEPIILDGFQLNSDPLHNYHPVLPFLQMDHYQWSENITRVVIDSIKRRILQGQQHQQSFWQIRYQLKQFAQKIPASLHEEISTDWPKYSPHWKQWESEVGEFLALVKFRQQMLESIRHA
ncbi:MAG: DUF5691 domain-containing protein [Chloroflexota bacterium]